MAKIYTKTGDEGMTGLISNRRVPKDDARIQAYGTVDELNAVLGVARAIGLDSGLDAIVAQIQDDLFVLGSALADPNPNGPFHLAIGEQHIQGLESIIDEFERELSPLTVFILPGGSVGSAQLHLARTICRRAERWVVSLSHHQEEDVPATLIIYLNRLSDLLFVMARMANHRADISDIPWKGI